MYRNKSGGTKIKQKNHPNWFTEVINVCPRTQIHVFCSIEFFSNFTFKASQKNVIDILREKFITIFMKTSESNLGIIQFDFWTDTLSHIVIFNNPQCSLSSKVQIAFSNHPAQFKYLILTADH